jgi:hypothetical protein
VAPRLSRRRPLSRRLLIDSKIPDRERLRDLRNWAAQNATQRDGPTRKLGADEPKIRLQLVFLQRVVSDGFDRRPANEPSPATKPRFQHLEKRPAAFWKSSKEDLERKVSRKERALRSWHKTLTARVLERKCLGCLAATDRLTEGVSRGIVRDRIAGPAGRKRPALAKVHEFSSPRRTSSDRSSVV